MSESKSVKTGIRLNGRMVVFFICFFISTLLWLLLTLSKEYSIALSFPVRYINLPVDKLIGNKLPQFIEIDVKATGFHLIPYELSSKREIIIIDLADAKAMKSKNHAFLLTNLQTDKVLAQFGSFVQIIRILPDTILLNFNKKESKRVPIKSNVVIEYADQYHPVDHIVLNPNFIDIQGSADALELIDTIETSPLFLKNVKNSLVLKLTILKTPQLKLIEFSQHEIQAKIKIAKYTEATIDLPIEVENIPSGYSLKTFPDKVSVKYSVAFENYEKMNASLFRVVVDYSKIEQGSNKLKLILLNFPIEVKNVKLNPEKVEYIIRK